MHVMYAMPCFQVVDDREGERECISELLAATQCVNRHRKNWNENEII